MYVTAPLSSSSCVRVLPSYKYAFLFSFAADNGVLTFQRLLGDFILSDSGAAAEGYTVSESGVAYTSFPTFAYEESGFFGDLGGTFFSPCLQIIPLLNPAVEC